MEARMVPDHFRLCICISWRLGQRNEWGFDHIVLEGEMDESR
jgi:hypothetical protein